MGPPGVTKDKVKAHRSAVGSVPDIYESNSQDQTMDVSSNDKVQFSTPQVNLRNHHTLESATLSVRSNYSVDSGFSDATLDSTWTSSVNDTSSLSAQSFPDSKDCSYQRLTLAVPEFSPINRGSLTGLSGRRLTFGAFDLPLPEFKLNQAEACENEFFDESVESHCLCVEDTKQSGVYNIESNSNLLHSVTTDHLKDSLQEMVIDKLPPSSTVSAINFVQFCESCQKNDCVPQSSAMSLPHEHLSTVDMETIDTHGRCCIDLEANCSNKFIANAFQPYTSQTNTHDSFYSSQNDFNSSNNSSSEAHNHKTDAEIGCFHELSVAPECLEESQMQINDDSHHYNFSSPKSESTSEAFQVLQNYKTVIDSDSFLKCRLGPHSDNPSPHNTIHKLGFSAVVNKKCSSEKFEQADSICDEKPTQSTLLIPHLHSRYNNDILEADITPNINLHTADSITDSLQKIIKKFSPSEPTRLIGRNIGVRKVDIVQELYSRNIHPGLERIFHYLAGTDFISIASVSTHWKLAMLSDKKAYNRYRQHKRSLSKSNLQHSAGKENYGEKPLDAPSEPSLTESRGLLSSVQSQASRIAICEPVSIVTVQDTLLSDDMLRICPRCQGPAMIKQRQDRATCMSEKCSYDFCTLCFSFFHHPRQCKPLCTAPSKGDLAGTRKSKKNLKRL